jgi:hypothetical protein
MPWTEINSKSKNDRSYIRHKGKKPVGTSYLHRTEDGKFKILHSTGAKGKDRDVDSGTNQTLEL